MATEMVGHRLVPLEQDKNLGGALCGWHRPRPPNAPKALKEWPLGCEASIGSRGRPTARSKLLERPWDPVFQGAAVRDSGPLVQCLHHSLERDLPV